MCNNEADWSYLEGVETPEDLKNAKGRYICNSCFQEGKSKGMSFTILNGKNWLSNDKKCGDEVEDLFFHVFGFRLKD